METVQTTEGSNLALDHAEVQEIASRVGLPELPPELLQSLVDVTKRRIEERLKLDRSDAIRWGAFSYLLEVTRAWPDEGELAMGGAVEIAGAFLNRNPASDLDSLDEGALRHFAGVIQSNGYDWEGLLIAYLDPEAARLDRLRQNLELSPTERWRRHQKLIPQIMGARRVKSSN